MKKNVFLLGPRKSDLGRMSLEGPAAGAWLTEAFKFGKIRIRI